MDIFVERANLLKDKERILSSIAQKNTMIRIVLAEIEVLTKQKCNHIDAVDKLRVEIRKHNIEKESLQNEIISLEAKVVELKKNLTSTEQELSSLSFVAFGRKKELKSKLWLDQKKVSDEASSLADKKSDLSKLEQTTTSVLLESEEGIVADLVTNIDEKNVELEKLRAELSLEESHLEEVTSKIAEYDVSIEKQEKNKTQVKSVQESEQSTETSKAKETQVRIVAEPVVKKTPIAVTENHFRRPFVSDKKLSDALDRAFDKLEAYFPEGKVFAFDSIDSHLRERMAELYKKAGYATIDDMFSEYGFEVVTQEAVKNIRSFVMYTPGNEPEIIKPKVESMLSRLYEYYPDKVINVGIQKEHKNLSQAVSGLYQWLGYDSAGDMLEAYGFTYNVSKGGRPINDFQLIIDTLVEKYKDGPKPGTMGEVLFDNPDLKSTIKTMQNKSNELFGMSLNKYFQTLGIICKGSATVKTSRVTSVGMDDAVLNAIKSRYQTLDESVCGTVDEALDQLKGLKVKRNKSGQVYIFRAVDCGTVVKIPYGIDFISDRAFMEQEDLEEVFVSTHITEIPAMAFLGCKNLKKIVIPEGVVSIGEQAFANCPSLTAVVLPSSLKKIGKKSFADCLGLKEVEILNPVALVSEDAFEGSPFEYVPAIEEDATDDKYFEYTCDRKGTIKITGFNGTMEQIVIPSMINGCPVTAIGKGAFQENRYIVDVKMPDSITTMQGDAFKDCISLKKIHLSNSISKIITTSFTGCVGLEEVNIPDEVTELKRSTFKNSPLKKLIIGKSLAEFDARAFYSGEHDQFTGEKKATRAISEIRIDSDNPYLTCVDSAVITKDGKELIAFLGNAKSFNVPDGVEIIRAYAFYDLAFLTYITFPDSLCEIHAKAFYLTALRRLNIGSNVKSIGEYAFAYCNHLTALIFDTGIEEIGDYAFWNCPIVSVVLPASLRILGISSFSCLYSEYYNGKTSNFEIDPANPYFKTDGNALYSISEEGLTLISCYGQKFKEEIYDASLEREEYKVADGTIHIAPHAFGYCFGLGKVDLPEGLISIGEKAFAECVYLNEITFPESLQSIGTLSFKGTSVSTFKLGTSVNHIGSGAFITGRSWLDKQTKLRKIEVNKSNKCYYADDKALYKNQDDGTTAIVTYFGDDDIFVLSEGITKISSYAFSKSNVQEVHIPSSVAIIGEHAFEGCDRLVRLRVAFAQPENGVDCAVIYIPEIFLEDEYFDTIARDRYMDCIRIDNEGNIFDFVKYDSLFETITIDKDKILIATDRLKSAIQLVPLYREKYLEYLRDNAEKAVGVVIEFDDLNGLNTLAELDVFTLNNIDIVIELANRANKPEVLSYLMNLKHSEIGIFEEEFEL